MIRKALPVTLAALASLCAASAWSGEPIGEADYARVNAALVEGHVVPRYARLAAATEAFAAAVDDFCADAGGESGRAAARARFHDAMDAWMAIRHLRFGPIELLMRGPRFYFWPQAQGKVREALRALAAVAEGDEAALLPPRFGRANVAAQGLLAAEALLYDEERLGIPTGAGSVGCRVLRAVAGNLRGMAAGTAADWQSGAAAFARVVARPGPENGYFQDHREATLTFFQSLHDGLQFVADAKLRPVVGDSLQAARPHLAESRSSGRSTRNAVGNLEALQALYLGEGGPGTRRPRRRGRRQARPAVAQGVPAHPRDRALHRGPAGERRDGSGDAGEGGEADDPGAGVAADRAGPAGTGAGLPGRVQRARWRLTAGPCSGASPAASPGRSRRCRSGPGPAARSTSRPAPTPPAATAPAAFRRAASSPSTCPCRGAGIPSPSAPARGEAVLLARRPGRFARAIALTRGSVAHRFAAPPDRHFQGHGAFGGDGRLLYASENDFDGERGVVGVYDAENGYRRVGELPSHGIGPHALLTLPDGEILVVANGGILTRPDRPRIKLNLPTMAPSLCHIDRRDGRLLRELRLAPDLHRLSIRHLAVGAGGAVAVAMQYEGPTGDLVPLVALHRGGSGALRPLAAPAAVWRAMKHYCGGICFDSGGRTIAVSAPRGHVVVFWDAGSGACLSSVRLADGCGVAPGVRPGTFLASGGNGDVVAIDARSKAADSPRRCPLRTRPLGQPSGGRASPLFEHPGDACVAGKGWRVLDGSSG